MRLELLDPVGGVGALSLPVSRLRRCGEELGESCLGRVTPPEAEGVTGRIGVHAVSMFGFRVRCILEESSAQVEGATMRWCQIGHVEVDVNLLWFSVRPIRRNVVWRTLHAG